MDFRTSPEIVREYQEQINANKFNSLDNMGNPLNDANHN